MALALTQEVIQRCVPTGVIVSPCKKELFGLGRNQKLAEKFSLSIPLGEVGLVVTQLASGRVLVHNKWDSGASDFCQIHYRMDCEEQLKEAIEKEIRRQRNEVVDDLISDCF